MITTPWMIPTETATRDEQKRVALSYITEAWIEAVKDGVDPDHVAEAAFEAAIREMVALKGEETVANLLAEIGPAVANGEFTAHLTRQ